MFLTDCRVPNYQSRYVLTCNKATSQRWTQIVLCIIKSGIGVRDGAFGWGSALRNKGWLDILLT